MKVLLINGPNLNLLGVREPGMYGTDTLSAVEDEVRSLGRELGVEVACFQSNDEGGIVERLHQAMGEGVGYVIVNAGAFTHTSVAIRDAFAAVRIPFVEVHISNVHRREAFRHHSYLSDIADGSIVGLGTMGYTLALRYVHARMTGAPA